jgi:hypothetical protein
MRVQSKQLVHRVEGLEAGDQEPEGGYVEGHLPGQPPGVLLDDKPGTRCTGASHQGVVGPDGVNRVMLPGGRTQVMRPCPKCEAG